MYLHNTLAIKVPKNFYLEFNCPIKTGVLEFFITFNWYE